MTVFVTGISGLLGTNLALLLLEKGYTVKGLVRNKKTFSQIRHERLHLVQGELQGDLSPHLKDVAVVIHAAAVTRQNLTRYSDYYKINYTATVQLMQAAIKMNVKKFIYVSTANTIGYGSDSSLVAPEQKPMKPPFTRSFYARSKAAAEQYVLQQCNKTDVIIINPTFMIGAHDSKPSSGKIILMGMKRRLLFCPPGGKNFVAVADVAGVIEKCIHAGQNGKRYLVAGENISYAGFFKKIRQQTHKTQWIIPLPRFILNIMGCMGDGLRYCNIKTNLSSNNMRILCINNFYSNSTSVKALQIRYQDMDEAIAESIRYFKAHH
ncbi:MAG: NAD-dependent epimerase/dehydratase family protein [Niabella sp.]